jgi:putative CocE/NonD family hydrolase
LLDSALCEHRQNFDIIQGVLSIDCRDDYRPGYPINADSCSPHRFLAQSRAAGVPYYWMTGWYDGAILGSSPKGFNAMRSQSRLIIGPWDHGPVNNGSPWRTSRELRFDVYGEMMRFFDYHLMNHANGMDALPRVFYYTVGAEQWRAANEWPPAEVTQWVLALEQDRSLSPTPQPGDWADTLRLPHNIRTGASSRYNSQTTLYKYLNDTHYDSIGYFLNGLPRFTTPPLQQATEITGHPIANLNIASPTEDASVFVYLIDLAPDGTRRYITEGMFRAAHRRIAAGVPPYPVQGPYHSFLRADFEPLEPGVPALLSFELLPISYELRAGHQLEVVLAGCDAEHFMPIRNAPPYVQLFNGSSIALPVMPRR